jgi:4-nitrophenyl phosphatase
MTFENKDNPIFTNSLIRDLILDMDGVLWRSTTPIGDLGAIFNSIHEKQYRVIMATNNATRSPKQYRKKLEEFGVEIEPWQVINSGIATAQYLKKLIPENSDVYVVGEPALCELLRDEGFIPGGAEPQAVIAALDRGITYEKLSKATLLIRSGIPFIGTNPDRSFPIPEGQAPGAGSILAALEAASGVAPVIIGKPQPEMYLAALERLGTAPETTLVVGDRLETDILGAQNAGCPCALVLTGVTTFQEAQRWNPHPDIIVEDLTTLVDLLPQAAST